MAFQPGQYAGIGDKYTGATRFDAPVRVTVVCYLLFSLAGLEMIWLVLLTFYPKPELGALQMPGYLMAIEWTQAILLAICTWYLLKGYNWARIAFFVLCAIRIIVLLVFPFRPEFGIEMGEAIVRVLVFGGLLVTRPANLYFAGGDPLRGKAPPNSKVPDEADSRRNEGKYNY
ncbi:MAG: hypothetical protein ABSE62_01315 [Chthoniobacteraceae bacterium]|jgi:hypothetical protein